MDARSGELSEAVRLRTLARFEAHRQAWAANPALRALYQRWYGPGAGPVAGSARWGGGSRSVPGRGCAQQLIPELELSDVVQAPWHAHQLAAEALPFGEGQVGALVLFDVLHHLRSPARFLAEATRVLAPGGRVVLCEPYVSPLSFPIYRFLHEEGCDLSVDPLAEVVAPGDDPFEGNQAVPTRAVRPPPGRTGPPVPCAAADQAGAPGWARLPRFGRVLGAASVAGAAVPGAAGNRGSLAGDRLPPDRLPAAGGARTQSQNVRVDAEASRAHAGRVHEPRQRRGGRAGRRTAWRFQPVADFPHDTNRNRAPASCDRSWMACARNATVAAPKPSTSRWRRQAPSRSGGGAHFVHDVHWYSARRVGAAGGKAARRKGRRTRRRAEAMRTGGLTWSSSMLG